MPNRRRGKTLWMITIIGSIAGGLIVVLGIMGSQGTPEQIAAACIGIACAVIPYCLAHAVDELRKE